MRFSFQANHHGNEVTVYLSADLSLWHWVQDQGQRVICSHADAVAWMKTHAIKSETARQACFMLGFIPPFKPSGYQGRTDQRKSTPGERMEPSMTRKYAHETQ